MWRFRKDLNNLVPINNRSEMPRYAGSHYSRDVVAGLSTILNISFTEKTVNQFGVTEGRNAPLSTDGFCLNV